MLSLEAVACKDWLTNKVDRSVTGRVARQQCQGEIQLPLSDCGVVALDYTGHSGIATSIGHAPQVALADSAKGSVMAVAEALTNIVGAPLSEGLKSVSLSANWMWPCKNPGEDAALYRAVEACSDFAVALGINIPTGKDSLSMTQKYADGKVYAPGTVIISAAGETADVRRTVSPVLRQKAKSQLFYIDFSADALRLGGSAFAQSLNSIGSDVPTVKDAAYFSRAFAAVQKLVATGRLLAMHDVSAGGLITTLLEMAFANSRGGIAVIFGQFGKAGNLYYDFARGIDLRPVEPIRIRKSVGCEHTLEKDISLHSSAIIELYHVVTELLERLKRTNFSGNTLTLKIKFHDFNQITRSITQDSELTSMDKILPLAKKLLKEIDYESHPIRLIGLSVSNPKEEIKKQWEQLSLEFKEWDD